MLCYSQKLMITKYCCFQTVIKLDKVWRQFLSLFSQKGAVGISKSEMFWIHEHSIALLQWLHQPVPFRSPWSYTWWNSDTEQPLQSGFSSMGTAAHWLIPTPIHHSVTDLFPAAVPRELKYLFLLTLCQHELKGRSLENHTCAVLKGQGGSNMERNSSTSPQPGRCQPGSTHPEGRAAGCSWLSPSLAFLSARDKVRGSFRHPGWLLKGLGLGCACSIPVACAGNSGSGGCVWKAQGGKAAVGEPLLTAASGAGTHSPEPGHPKGLCCALPSRSQGQVCTRVPPGLCLMWPQHRTHLQSNYSKNIPEWRCSWWHKVCAHIAFAVTNRYLVTRLSQGESS